MITLGVLVDLVFSAAALIVILSIHRARAVLKACLRSPLSDSTLVNGKWVEL